MSEKKKPAVLLEHHLKRLKLPTMLREYASMATVCRDDRSDYPTYLLRLAERELLDRERRAAERRVKEARFPVVKNLDTFDFGFQPSIHEPLVRELLGGEFISQRAKKTVRPNIAKKEMQQIYGFLDLYELDNGFYPYPQQGLVALHKKPTSPPVPKNWRQYMQVANLTPSGAIADPWDTPYHYVYDPATDRFPTLESAGPDRKFGTADDLRYP